MAFNESWNIRPRSNECSKTKESFKDGQAFYTAIFKDDQSAKRLLLPEPFKQQNIFDQ